MKPLPPQRFTPETTNEERRGLRELLKTALISSPHLEIGTAAGATLAELMSCYPNDKRPKFVVVDPFTYFQNQMESVRDNLVRSGIDPDTVDFRQGTSAERFREAAMKNEKFGFIFIDGNHRIEFVVPDLRWTRLLEENGYVCLHDYSASHPGVVHAVDRFLKRNPNYNLVSQHDSLVILRKTVRSARPEIDIQDLIWSRMLGVVLHWQNLLRKRKVRH